MRRASVTTALALGWCVGFAVVCGGACVGASGATARASGPLRHTFEPTDLELEEPGTTELDLQFGYVGGGNRRLITPDLEFDLGLTENVEFDVDATLFLVAPDLRLVDAENLWLAMKLGLWDARDEAGQSAWALGIQLGPRVPAARGAHGAGYEALVLIAHNVHGNKIVLNAGGLLEPGDSVGRPRPVGAEAGLDLELPITKRPELAILGEFGALHYFAVQPDSVTATCGVQWSLTESLDISVVGLLGFLHDGDRYGAFLGVSPKFALW